MTAIRLHRRGELRQIKQRTSRLLWGLFWRIILPVGRAELVWAPFAEKSVLAVDRLGLVALDWVRLLGVLLLIGSGQKTVAVVRHDAALVLACCETR